MATRRKRNDQNETTDTVLGGDTHEWRLRMSGTSLDIRECSNCGFTSDFPKDMNKCIWTRCPNCHKEMRW